ncbi:MAG: lamin tail domain-containing protein [Candidatus Eisenbacteria bacterium]
MRIILIGMFIVALPAMAAADVIPISDVNENGASGFPVLRGSIVTVQGVAVVATGALDDNTDIYIQDATGGVNILQPEMASPIIALGDSVRVTGYVDHATSSGRTALIVRTLYPDTRMVVVNSDNEIPAPLELTPRQISESGNELYEGRYAVVRGVSLAPGSTWVNCGDPPSNRRTRVEDEDYYCWLWFDSDTDLCGSDEPLETFDIYGVVVPDIRTAPGTGHGILPAMRSQVLSTGPGSGFATVDPGRVFADNMVDLSFTVRADGGELTQLSIGVPGGWTFSGSASDVTLDGPALATAVAAATPDVVVVTGCELSQGNSGTVTLAGVIAPSSAGDYQFEVKTADDGGDLASIQTHPEIGVGVFAEPGVVLINEIYAHSGGADLLDRSEFIELYNPGATAVDLTGWVLTDISNSGACGGSNLWAFPEGTALAGGEYVVIAKDAVFSNSNQTAGFYRVFGEWPDFEMVDPYGTDHDSEGNGVRSMILVSPDDGNASVSQEIRLIGGSDGNGTVVDGTPAYEAILLYTDQTTNYLVDSVEYRNPVFLEEDPCAGAPGLGGLYDAWTPGPPPRDTSLARDAVSTDTDVSRDDFFLAAPTPGDQNPDSDATAPSVSSASGASYNLALVVFSEPVDPADAENHSNYTVGGGVTVLEATLSRDGRTVLLRTTDRTPGASYSIDVAGVADIAGNPMESFSGAMQIGATTIPITAVQEYDENGFSIRAGQTVKTVGFTTVPPGVFQPTYTSMYIQEPGGAGVNVFAFGLMQKPAREGDLVSATGEIVDYISSSSGAGATTEIEASSVTVLARGFDPVEPIVMETGDVGHEDNEGLFVQTSGIIVSVQGFALYIDDGSGSIQIYQNFNDLDFSQFAVGDHVRMTGVILQYDQSMPFLSGYELSPRYDWDMEILESQYSASADIEISARVLDLSSDEAIEINYNAPAATHVTVRIFDLKGRKVATVYDGICLGPQRTTWDARDDAGKRVPMGAYLCHVLARDRGPGEGSSAAVPIVVGIKLD